MHSSGQIIFVTTHIPLTYLIISQCHFTGFPEFISSRCFDPPTTYFLGQIFFSSNFTAWLYFTELDYLLAYFLLLIRIFWLSLAANDFTCQCLTYITAFPWFYQSNNCVIISYSQFQFINVLVESASKVSDSPSLVFSAVIIVSCS